MWLRWVQAAMGVQVLVHVDHDHHFDHVDHNGDHDHHFDHIDVMVRWSWSSCWSWSCLQWTWVIRWWGILWLSWICAHWALIRLFDADESGNIELDEMFEIVATFYDMEVRQITQGDGTISILMLFIKVKNFHHKEMRFYMGESWDLSDRTNLLAVLSP